MPCKHNWLFTTPCPKCAAEEEKHVYMGAVDSATGGDGDRLCDQLHGEEYVEPPLPSPSDDGIPPFLRRRAGGGWMYPSLHRRIDENPVASETGVPVERSVGSVSDSMRFVGGSHLVAPPLRFLSNNTVLTALSDHTITCADRQKWIKEAERREMFKEKLRC